MSTSHTPGPWEATIWECHALTTIRAKNRIIAECAGNGRYAKDCEADARLIAAAPDLLAALQDALEALSWHGGLDFQNDAGQPVGDLIRSAIARAKGQP
jgi:hypothetical protein